MKTFRLLFSDDMARAIVSGRKTVTRRPVDFRKLPHGVIEERDGFGLWPFWEDEAGDWHPETRCAAVGDLLIGRECWCPRSGGSLIIDKMVTAQFYRATDGVGDMKKPSAWPWRPSIHMPDWAARIRRRVVSVTVEHVQDVTIQDAVREGFPTDRHGGTDARNDFLCAWDDIYINRGLASAVNPWVWRIEFERENVQEGGVK